MTAPRSRSDLPGCWEMERRFPGWQVYRAREDWMVRPDIPVPAGHYWATHFEYERPCVVAPDRETLAARLAVVDQARLDEAIAEVERRYPGWRVWYVRERACVRGLSVAPGEFCAIRRWGYSWLHVAHGLGAEELIREIAYREEAMREVWRWRMVAGLGDLLCRVLPRRR